jgi:DNA-3-methyladenine glycosylase II
MPTLRLANPPGFRLQAASHFYESFVPGSGMAAVAADHLTLAFRLDKTFDPVVVALREEGGSLLGDYAGTSEGALLERQVSRMLGLDADADAWRRVGERDDVVGRLQAEFPGFFAAAKPSPYDAATWAMIAPRTGIQTAARLKIAIAERHGDAVTLKGRTHHVFPAPRALERLERFPGLPVEKLERLRAMARAALEGALDVERLRGLTERESLGELMTLRGVGPWAASHILYRGAAIQDGLPTVEPRVLHGLASAYEIAAPSIETFERIAENWRPFRMWVCVLLSRHLRRGGGWHASGMTREREAAGKRLRSAFAQITKPNRPSRASS